MRIGESLDLDPEMVERLVEGRGVIRWDYRGLVGVIHSERIVAVYESWLEWQKLADKPNGTPPEGVGRFTWEMVEATC
ncbi:MAG: hypothetical protein AAGG38_10475 [Planctomycetota bacterium]